MYTSASKQLRSLGIDLLSVDKVASLLNLVQDGLDIVVPRVQLLVGELLACAEDHNA